MKEGDIIGKTVPEKDDLKEILLSGFKEIELGLRKEDLFNIKKTISVIESSGINVLGVHTPHAVEEDLESFQRSAKIAEHFNAMLIVHSGRIPLTHSCRLIEKINYKKKAIESNPGESVKIIESCIFKNGHNFVFDNAHIFIGSKDFMKDTKYLFKNYGPKIKWIHLSDSTLVQDGLQFGKGEFNFAPLLKFMDKNYKGKIVVEVMPKFQKAAKEYILEVLGK
jgi:sugar phosphate isomerase/epimerase